jgi:hypothetical protein
MPEFETTAQGCRVATSVGGVLTGRGADIIIIDDPLKPEEALSQAQRQAANEWYDHTLYSRLNDARSGAIILIMHRLHESLPSGVTRGTTSRATCWRGRMERSCASRRSPRTTRIGRSTTELGRHSFTRQRGEALHPERQPLAILDHIRRTIGGQYQQMPSPQGGGMVKAAWFRAYAANERPDKFDHFVQSWDTANKASELSDFSGCTSWGIEGKDLYLLHMLRRRMKAMSWIRLRLPPLPTRMGCAETWRQRCLRRRQLLVNGICLPS